jgi:hypothetical protein
MALNIAHMLSTSVLQPAPIESRPIRSPLIRKDGPDLASGLAAGLAPGLAGVEPEERGAPSLPAQARRTRIWEFGTALHCSIVGTCLTTAELRHILEKLKVGDAGAASDHDLHGLGVMLAGRREEGGAKFLQKALDRRHRAAITRYAKAKDAAALIVLWEESLRQGDVPGAYWAVLTHPVTTEDVVKRAFGDVHMLSHLMGAANRADIRRLRQLEQETAALAAKVERQQRQLRDGFLTRDQTIRRLNEMLASQAGATAAGPDEGRDDGEATDSLVRDLNRRLARETARRERSDERAGELSATLREKDRALQAMRRDHESTRHELDLVERHLAALARPETRAEALDLAGVTILYVGGRAHQVPQLKALIERAGGRFLHHDGGIEHSSGLLPGLVSRADRVVFPIDCISHDAAAAIKRLCRLAGKTYAPLRTASLACLLSALMSLCESAEGVAAE